MDFLDLAKERYSVRKFSGKKVEKEKLDKILEAGRLAPTAVNFQPQRILVLDSEENLAKLKECTQYHFNAPLAILVCYDKTVSWKRKHDNKDEGEIDASIVTTHMMMEIANLGLGSTWVGYFDPAAVIQAYGLPENIIPVAILPTGYPSEESAPSAMHGKRVDMEQTVFFNSFEGVEKFSKTEQVAH
ncbi:MAG: nitroreductase family protein [Firmicutes bacterium]|nr:nitroreductase family protein [Bacillota bacterium]